MREQQIVYSVIDREKAFRTMREKHGFIRPKVGKTSASTWSRAQCAGDQLINALREELGCSYEAVAPAKEGEFPKNRELFDLLTTKFASIEFAWSIKRGQIKHRNGSVRDTRCIDVKNHPTVGGAHLTLADMALIPVEICDQYKGTIHREAVESSSHIDIDAMNATGIGYKGFEGVSWLPLTHAFTLPAVFEGLIMRVAAAAFLLYDAVTELYGKDASLSALLEHKVPGRIPRLVDRRSRVRILRPDMVVVEDDDGLRPVITELESCPAGHGMMHAMQRGYGLATGMVDTFVRYLGGRAYTVVATAEWAEYVWDQAAFCHALRKRGVDARVIFDRPLEEIADMAQTWEAPKGVGVTNWNKDFMGRLRKHSFSECVSGSRSFAEVSTRYGVLFRFGYFDNYAHACELLAELGTKPGVEIMNPASFFLESKALMAAAKLRSVRAWIESRDHDAVHVLDRCLAETRVLGLSDTAEFFEDRGFWISKFAAWDGDNKSWGARSLIVGAQTSADAWERALVERCDLPHPVVMQHVINSARFDGTYQTKTGEIETLIGARTRLTPFFIRDGDQVRHGGSMITLRNSYRVHGSTDAVEAPVIFTDKEGV